MNMTIPATAATTTTRQRRERSRPSGNSSAGRVTPRAIAGAHNQYAEGERPGHDQGHDQAGGAATEGSQPQTPGQYGPGPGLQLSHLLLGVVGACTVILAGQRYGIVTAPSPPLRSR